MSKVLLPPAREGGGIENALGDQHQKNRTRRIQLTIIPDDTDLRDKQFEPGLTGIAKSVPVPDFLWPASILCSQCRVRNQCRHMDATEDAPDAATLRTLERERQRLIRNQGQEGSCTGHALAAVIDVLRLRREFSRPTGCYRSLLEAKSSYANWRNGRVSARMLYQMALSYEFAPDSELQGSSIRNVLKAFHHNGVCTELSSPYEEYDYNWSLKYGLAKEARQTLLSGYYRVPLEINAWHAAINEVGALLVSAVIHDGWRNLVVANNDELTPADIQPNHIPLKTAADEYLGGHAFAVVGYDENGFYVLNSWGGNWGRAIDSDYKINTGVPGVALWSYEDWREHVFDAWVFRLAHPSSDRAASAAGWLRKLSVQSGVKPSSAPRLKINGHYLHLNSKGPVRIGKYPSEPDTFNTTVEFLKNKANDVSAGPVGYQDVALILAHGTMNLNREAGLVEGLVHRFKRSGVYPVFVFWNYAESTHLFNIVDANRQTMLDRHGPNDRAFLQRMNLELGEFGQLFLARLHAQVQALVPPAGASVLTTHLQPIFDWIGSESKRLHLVCHSDGTWLLNKWLRSLRATDHQTYTTLKQSVKSCQLIAPPLLQSEIGDIEHFSRRQRASKDRIRIRLLTLTEQNEKADSVGEYPATYPQLIQNIFHAGYCTNPDREVIGLHEHAYNRRGRSVYSHTAVGGLTNNLHHFAMLSDPAAIDTIIDHIKEA